MANVRPNLARRPFVDSRPSNVAAVVLLLATVVLTLTSVRTIHAYLEGSRKSREEIALLREEIARFEASRREAEQKLSKFDLEGMLAGAEEANGLARLRAFSWSRFLTRLEKTLPNDFRVVSIGLGQPTGAESAATTSSSGSGFRLTLSLVSQDPDGMPRLLRAFYASPWFDAPTPVAETGAEKGAAAGPTVTISAVYRDREAKP